MFDVVKNKIMYGKKVEAIERSTFLIGVDVWNGAVGGAWPGGGRIGTTRTTRGSLLCAVMSIFAPRMSLIFANKMIRAYPGFRDLYGMNEVRGIVSYFRHGAQGLEERKQVRQLAVPLCAAKSTDHGSALINIECIDKVAGSVARRLFCLPVTGGPGL